MRRRASITLLGGAAAAWPLAARAQQPAMPVVGFLGLQPASAFAPRIEALPKGLRELGYVEGKNLLIDFQWADSVDQLPGIVRRLVDSRVDLIFAPSSTWVEPARQATKTIPIVFANHADPVGLGTWRAWRIRVGTSQACQWSSLRSPQRNWRFSMKLPRRRSE
jgi:putative tryptophan/tyrosine transport system substrate-binding protein